MSEGGVDNVLIFVCTIRILILFFINNLHTSLFIHHQTPQYNYWCNILYIFIDIPIWFDG